MAEPEGPAIGETCPRCGYLLDRYGVLLGTKKSAKYPCASCLVAPPRCPSVNDKGHADG